MYWKHIKIISAIIFVCLVSTLSFTIGVSYGVKFSQDSFINVLLPSLSAFGSWISGLGALAAVFTSLWLAEQNKKLSGEILENIFDVFEFENEPNDRLAIKVTSIGNKPSIVQSISITSKKTKVALMIANLDPAWNTLPMQINYGQQGVYVLPIKSEDSINDYVTKNCSGSYKSIEISVNTTVNSFKIPFNKQVIKHLQQRSANK